ncbi:NAD-dependent epimerase/dehydratase family protein [Candidatus Pelagibacter sp. Uisw_090]|uniref:NAD-dependent epimerase/dehydratase family protein n=1 Tax=Candidatus Pelagibacter sp. Uisw_090 TaxID=3230993 RepID=UPI0039E9D0C1
MDDKIIIIGRNSNLSNHLLEKLKNAKVISSREISNNIDILSEFKNQKIKLIFNNFHPAIKLNEMINAEEYIMNSIGLTSKILNYFLINDIKINKIIYTSSSSVYGNNKFSTETDELKPLNLYASLKIANEKMIEKFSTDNKINYTISRLFNMYGGNDKFSIISKIFFAIKTTQEITIVNNGNSIRDFIHINDVVDIYIKLLNIKNIKVVNIGTGIGRSVKSIIKSFAKYKIKIFTKNISRNELKESTANIKILNKILDKKIFIQIEDYIKEQLSHNK